MGYYIVGREVRQSIPICLVLSVLAMCSVALLEIPVVHAADEASGGMVATVATVVDVDISKLPKWTNISKGATDALADSENGNPMQIIIKSATTVPTKAQVKGSENLQKTSGIYDHIPISNVKMARDSGKTSIFSLTTGYADISWLTNIAVPGGSDNTQNVYMFLSTRADQTAGTYNGTIFIKLVALE